MSMAVGADKALLEEQHAQSVYKHAILEQYLPRFIAKTGALGTPVALVDGFAGTGRAGAGLGSAGLMLRAALKMSKIVDTTLYLVEQDRTRHAQLAALTEEFAMAGVRAHARQNSIEVELDAIIGASSNASLFLFLDPCGALLPFDRLVTTLTGSRSRRWPPTEAVLNLSADLTRRASGQMLAGGADQRGALRLDQVCGDTWWREIAARHAPHRGNGNYRRVAHEIAHEYARRLGERTKMIPIVVPVARLENHQPIYHLVFLTRSEHGVATFADAVGRARPEWLAAMPTDPTDDDLFSLSGWPLLPTQEARKRAIRERETTSTAIEENIVGLAQRLHSFRPLEHIPAIYGTTMGIACDTQINLALRTLVAAGRLRIATPHREPVRRTYRSIDQP